MLILNLLVRSGQNHILKKSKEHNSQKSLFTHSQNGITPKRVVKIVLLLVDVNKGPVNNVNSSSSDCHASSIVLTRTH